MRRSSSNTLMRLRHAIKVVNKSKDALKSKSLVR